MLNCFRLLPPVPPPARSSPAHRSAVWYCWSMRALASLRRCCMLALWASNPSCLNIVGTYRMSRSNLFSAPSTLAKPNPLTMKSQAEGKKNTFFPENNAFFCWESKWEDSLLAWDWDVCVYINASCIFTSSQVYSVAFIGRNRDCKIPLRQIRRGVRGDLLGKQK